jgi:hypothetical protein
MTGVPSFTGSFSRLILTYDGRHPEAPRTLVAKCSTAEPKVRTAVHSMGFYQREAMFYRELASRTPIAIPRCYYSRVDPDGRSLMLLEDLTAGRPGRSSDAMALADTQLAIDTIARLHAHWWESPDLHDRPLLDHDSIMPADDATENFVECWPLFLAKLSIPITDAVHRLGKDIAQHLQSTLRELFHAPPLTLIHDDYHRHNLIFDGRGATGLIWVIDWQLVLCGRGIIDVANLVADSLEPRQRVRAETRLVVRYANQLARHGVHTYPADQALHDYRRALLIPPARLAMAVASSPGLTAHRGAFWDVQFDRHLCAWQDNARSATAS